jgi:carbamoyltransferase
MSTIYGFFGGSHSPSACLIRNGKIVSCIEEERLTRIKAGDNFDSFPELSSEEIQKYTGLNVHDADYRVFVEPVIDAFAKKLTKDNFERVGHHDAHCYGSYFTSGMDGKVLSISYDGGGDKTVMKVYLCEDGKMNLAYSYDFATTGSIPHLWAFSVTSIRGYNENGESIWKMCKDEGKLMGMAPDGFYDERIYKILNSIIDYKDFKFFPSNTGAKARFVVDTMFRKGYFDSQEKLQVFSFNLQKLTEDLFLNFLDDLHTRFPDYKKLCFSGGLFANVKLNQKINQLPWVEEIYIVPPMGDEGLSLGACIKKAVDLGEITKPFKLDNVFFGKEYDDDQISLISQKYNFEKKIYNPSEIAKNIDEGEIIGWFQHGFEFGPRALGGRSILMRPTSSDTHSKLNKRLKRHDSMPFAPIVMSEYFDEIFFETKSKYSAEFMTICYQTKENWIEKIPAVIQKSDKTARPQIVKREKNYKFWEILDEYYKISNIPVLLNTSFNTHNEPIVDNPEQAFSKLQDKTLDKLVIGNYVYTNR